MMKKIGLCFAMVSLFLTTQANYLLVSMDETQQNHLKAYGVAFQSLKNQNTVQWLLNYKGGAFLLQENEANQTALNAAGVSFENLTDAKTQIILQEVLAENNSKNLITLTKLPKIAVYAPSTAKPYDDAVLVALKYAGIDFTQIYDKEVLKSDLSQFDWIHLHHEDFTGQFGKWNSYYKNESWYQDEKKTAASSAKDLGFSKVSQMKLAVAKKLKSFVENGGQLFAMCSGGDLLDVALAAEKTDIVPAELDGDGIAADANAKLNFANTLAFQNFTINLNPIDFAHSNIAVKAENLNTKGEKIQLNVYDAKQYLTDAMLTQNHQSTVKFFAGQTVAYNKQFVKPNTTILATDLNPNEVRYLHGNTGKGTFTFLTGHEPEEEKHYVGSKEPDLNKFKNSAGYRLILNNVLFPSARNKTAGIVDSKDFAFNVYPNPFVDNFSLELKSKEIHAAKITVLDMQGNIVAVENLNNEMGKSIKKIDGSAFAAGIYIVELSNEKGLLGQQMVVKSDK